MLPPPRLRRECALESGDPLRVGLRAPRYLVVVTDLFVSKWHFKLYPNTTHSVDRPKIQFPVIFARSYSNTPLTTFKTVQQSTFTVDNNCDRGGVCQGSSPRKIYDASFNSCRIAGATGIYRLRQVLCVHDFNDYGFVYGLAYLFQAGSAADSFASAVGK